MAPHTPTRIEEALVSGAWNVKRGKAAKGEDHFG
jgi:hypothetical protein